MDGAAPQEARPGEVDPRPAACFERLSENLDGGQDLPAPGTSFLRLAPHLAPPPLAWL